MFLQENSSQTTAGFRNGKLGNISVKKMYLLWVVISETEKTQYTQAKIGSESDCLLEDLKRILDISDSDVGLEEDKSEVVLCVEMFINEHCLVNLQNILHKVFLSPF